MSEFILLFRQPSPERNTLSPTELEAITRRWQEWVGSIAAQGKLSGRGTRLPMEGKVLKADGMVTDGPFVEIKERLGGFIIVQTDSLDEAVRLAHGCPVLSAQGSVEIRPILD